MNLPANLLDEFEILGELPDGSGLESYCVVRRSSGTRHVLRKLPMRFEGKVEVEERFRDFFLSYHQILRCCIPQRQELQRFQGVWFALEEYLPGAPLTEELLRTLDPEAVAHMFADVCLALNNAHNKGVRHLCVSPECLWVDDNKTVTLRGFGLEIFVHSGLQARLDERYRKYVAPEVLQRGAVHNSSDVYSLARTIAELCPEYRDNPEVRRALSEDPNQRFTGMLVMEESLSQILATPRDTEAGGENGVIEKLIIRVQPSGAEILLRGKTDLTCKQSPDMIEIFGEHDKWRCTLTVEVRKSGYRGKDLTIKGPPATDEYHVSLDPIGRIIIIRSEPPGACLEVVNGTHRQSSGALDSVLRFEVRELDKPLTINASKYGCLPKTLRLDLGKIPIGNEVVVALESVVQYVTIKTEPPEAIVKDALTGHEIGCTYAGSGVTIPWAAEAKLIVEKSGFRSRRLKFSANRPSRPIVSTIQLEPVYINLWTNPAGVEVRDKITDQLLGVTDGAAGLQLSWRKGRELLLIKGNYQAHVYEMPSVPPVDVFEERVALKTIEASVTANPEGARLIDRATGSTLEHHCYPKFPVRVSWRPGSDIWLEKQGYESIQLPWGDRTENFSIHFELEGKKSRDTVRVLVITDPVGASVTVDAQFLGVTQATGTQWKIAPGMRKISLQKHGYKERTVVARIPNKRSHVVGPVKLKPKRITVITHPAQAFVRTPLAVVGKTSPEGLKVPWHRGPIIIEKPGYLTVARDFTKPPESMLLEISLDRVPVEKPKPRPTKPPEEEPTMPPEQEPPKPRKPHKPEQRVPPQRASGLLTRLVRWLYPPERPDNFPPLLMTQNWGVPKYQLEKKDAKKRKLVLYRDRWVSRSERYILTKQFLTCSLIRVTSMSILILGLLIFPVSVTSGASGLLVGLPALALAVFTSSSLWQFRPWAHYAAGLVCTLVMPLLGIGLLGAFPPAGVAILIAWIVGMWAMCNDVGRQIFSRKVRETRN